MTAAITRVRHIALGVASIEAALALYRDVLGLRVVADDTDTEGQRTVTLPAGLSALLLIETGADSGIDHVAFDSGAAALPRSGLMLAPADHLGLPIALFPPMTPPPPPAGPVECIDHLVIGSGNSGAVAEHFATAFGLEIKRKMIRPGTSAQLAFGKLHDVVIEFAGPPEPKAGPVEANFWGLVLTVKEIEAVVASIRAAGYDCGEPKPAVQPGAKIATIKGNTGGVPLAIIQYNAIPA